MSKIEKWAKRATSKLDKGSENLRKKVELLKMPSIVITVRGGYGLSSKENKEVLLVLKNAKARGKLPPLRYEYNPHPRLYGKDPIYLKTKAPLELTSRKVRSILMGKFGDKYKVRI